MGVDGFIVEEHPLRIETHHFATSAKAWVDTHNAFLPERSGEQQLFEVSGKHTDGLFVGLCLARGGKFRFDAGF